MTQQDFSVTGEFEVVADLQRIAIPREEIIEAMTRDGEDEVLNRVCIAVATVYDAIESARLRADL